MNEQNGGKVQEEPKTELRAPPVPQEIDLSTMKWMPLDVSRLLRSETLRLGRENPDAFRASVILWCNAWHGSPASSLPNDDEKLAHLVEMRPKTFSKHRDLILRGFVLCSDGRLYHPIIAEKAIEAWAFRQKQSSRAAARYSKTAPGQLSLGGNSGDKLGTSPSSPPAAVGAAVMPREGTAQKGTVFVLPDWIPIKAWNGYVEMRKLIRKPLTERAMELEVRKLLAFKQEGQDPEAILDQSTVKSWQGLFPVKKDGGSARSGAISRDAVAAFAKGAR